MLIALFVALFGQTSANNIYVYQKSTGNGTSWADAFGSLSEALAVAKAGDEIWVAKGTYTPDPADRNARFEIPSGVKVYGGFSGNEVALEERNIEKNPTTLSGEIGAPGLADNSYTIVYFANTNENTLLDGFLLTGANANGELEEEANPSRSGGAIYVNGENGIAKPVIANCSFTANFARDGAAVYNNGRNGNCSPTFINCTFTNNEAGLDGGAIYNDGRMNGNSHPTLTNCHFERNMGTYGGAICNSNEAGVCNLTLTNCTFKENAAYLRGGAIFSMNGNQRCYLELSDCHFDNNFPDDQNMIFTSTTGRSDAYRIASNEP